MTASSTALAALASPGPAAAAPADAPAARQDTRLAIDGMTCASCVARVEKALRRVPGVAEATVNLATETATVSAGAEVSYARLDAAIERAG